MFRKHHILLTNKHLPHQSIFLKDLSCLQPEPEQRQQSNSPSAIRRVAVKISKVLQNTKFLSHTRNLRWPSYDSVPVWIFLCTGIRFRWYSAENRGLLYFVGKIKDFDGNFNFANAGPEREFSENKIILDGR